MYEVDAFIGTICVASLDRPFIKSLQRTKTSIRATGVPDNGN